MRGLVREPALGLLLLGLLGLMSLFIIYPQVQVVIVPGLSGYTSFFEGGTWIKPLQNSITVTVLSTSTAVLLGFIYAYTMVYSDMPWKGFFGLIAILPLLSPPFVVAASYILLFGPRGLITWNIFGQATNVIGMGGIWGVQTIAYFPFAYQLIADVLSRSNPALEQAARNLGAGAWEVFRTVTLPLSRPGLASAILITAIYILEDFGNPALIGGQYTVLPTQAYSLISGFGDFEGAAAVSTLLLILALILYVFHLRLEGERSFVTITGRASSIPRSPVPRLVTRASFLACLVLAGLILLVYGVLLVSAFVVAFPANNSLTLNNLVFVGAHIDSLRNTLVYGGSAAIICTIFAVPAWISCAATRMARTPGRGFFGNHARRDPRHLLRYRLRDGIQHALLGLARPRRADHDLVHLLEYPGRLSRLACGSATN